MGAVSGISFPLRFGAEGHLLRTVGLRKLHDNVKAILTTRVGERLSRHFFGVLAAAPEFRNLSDARIMLIRQLVLDAVQEHEPRVQVVDVRVVRDSAEGTLSIQVDFQEALTKAVDSAKVSFPWG